MHDSGFFLKTTKKNKKKLICSKMYVYMALEGGEKRQLCCNIASPTKSTLGGFWVCTKCTEL